MRELKEAGPYRGTQVEDKHWPDHLGKDFVHRRLFQDLSANRDFILSLDPSLIYFVSQLWDAHRTSNAKQWLNYLEKLAEKYPHEEKLSKVHKQWEALLGQKKPQ